MLEAQKTWIDGFLSGLIDPANVAMILAGLCFLYAAFEYNHALEASQASSTAYLGRMYVEFCLNDNVPKSQGMLVMPVISYNQSDAEALCSEVKNYSEGKFRIGTKAEKR